MANKLRNTGLLKLFSFIKEKGYAFAEYFILYNYGKKINPTVPLELIKKYNRSRRLGPKKIICNAPFTQIYFKQDGKMTACCASGADAYGNIGDDSIYNVWNGGKAKQLRDRIMNYNLSGGCTGCQHSLETGNYNAFIGRIYDTVLPVRRKSYPTDMTFEISNTCNLECIMCSGEFSNLIRKNVEQLPERKNYYDESFFEEILEFLPYLKCVRFMGGEPFLIKQYAPIMEYLVENNPQCKIYIQTNGTILNNAVKKIVESENVEISISVDSLQKENYEMIRRNGSYERTMKNLEYFSHRAKENRQNININFCIMNINWQEVPAVVEFCIANHFTLNLIPVDNPRYLSLRICTTSHLNDILEFSSRFIPEIKNTGLLSVYRDYLNHLNALITDSRKNTEKRDKLLCLTEVELYEKAKRLFIAVNNIKADSKDMSIFDKVFLNSDGLNEAERKIVFSNLIIELENVDTLVAKSIQQSYDELFLKSRMLLENMKAEIREILTGDI